MAYKINNTVGTLLGTLADGTIDVATTDLTLIGKGYAGFGEKLNENLVKLLENFNNTTAPSNKVQGQMWYDKTNNQINVYTGSKWKPVGSTTKSATAPIPKPSTILYIVRWAGLMSSVVANVLRYGFQSGLTSPTV